jgi:hypothetical protein
LLPPLSCASRLAPSGPSGPRFARRCAPQPRWSLLSRGGGDVGHVTSAPPAPEGARWVSGRPTAGTLCWSCVAQCSSKLDRLDDGAVSQPAEHYGDGKEAGTAGQWLMKLAPTHSVSRRAGAHHHWASSSRLRDEQQFLDLNKLSALINCCLSLRQVLFGRKLPNGVKISVCKTVTL